ncbi:MAG: gamma-glutamylcyclotransferase family protein [Synechococcaceae cyanobacterium]|nr:gamma-glutamylcyclotransferase family protein [Synechococcaceae cyanobacterium]
MTVDPQSTVLAGEHPVFVYGSLKAAERNHHWLASAPFLGPRQLHGAVLFERHGFPMALLTGETGVVVHGELYAVSGEGLSRLDQLEDYPHDYDRSLCTLSSGERAWVYHGRPEQVLHLPRVAEGDWHSRPVFLSGSRFIQRIDQKA